MWVLIPCIKDMASILTPYTAYELVKRLKEFVDVPIQLHTRTPRVWPA